MKDRIISSSVFLTRILESYTVLSTVNDSVFWRPQLTSDWYRNASAGQRLPVVQCGCGIVQYHWQWQLFLFIRDHIKRNLEVRPSNPHFQEHVNMISQIKTLKSAPTVGLTNSSFPQMTSSGDFLFRLTLQISPLENWLKSRHTSYTRVPARQPSSKLASCCVLHRMCKVMRQKSTGEKEHNQCILGLDYLRFRLNTGSRHTEEGIEDATLVFQEPIVNLIQIVTVQLMCRQPRYINFQRKETYSSLNGSINRFLRERCQDR